MNRQKAFGQGNPELAAYTENLFQPVDALLAQFQERARAAGLPEIQVGPMDGRHLEILTRLLKPKRIVEIGTLAGVSGLCFLRGMESLESGESGALYTFEKNELHAKIARTNLEHARDVENFRASFEIFSGPALENLTKIEAHGPFDLVFIDADKPNYPNYFDWAVKNLRVGGAIVGDNTFAWGEVHLVESKSGNDRLMVGSLHEFNRRVSAHPKLRGTILPTAEGLTVAVKIRD